MTIESTVKNRAQSVLPALLQKLVGEFFILGGNFAGNVGGNLAGIFYQQNKGSKNRGKIRSIFREKICASKKLFRANFVLQTCHPNISGAPIFPNPINSGKKKNT